MRTSKLAKTRMFWKWFRGFVKEKYPSAAFCNPGFYFSRSESERAEMDRMAREAMESVFTKDKIAARNKLLHYMDELIVNEVRRVDYCYTGKYTSDSFKL